MIQYVCDVCHKVIKDLKNDIQIGRGYIGIELHENHYHTKCLNKIAPKRIPAHA